MSESLLLTEPLPPPKAIRKKILLFVAFAFLGGCVMLLIEQLRGRIILFVPAVVFLLLLQTFWRFPIKRGWLLFQVGLAAASLAWGVGMILAVGETDDDILMAPLVTWLGSALCGSLLLIIPHQRNNDTGGRALLREYFRFSLRDMVVGVTILAVLLGVASIDRGERPHTWHFVYDFGGPPSLYSSAADDVHRWLTERGFVRGEKPGFNNYRRFPGDVGDVWYVKYHDAHKPYYVSVAKNEKTLSIEVHYLRTLRALPSFDPRERECDRVSHELRDWWRQFKSEHSEQ